MKDHSRISRAEIGDAQTYWQNQIDELINSMLPFYDYEIETASQFTDKNETTCEDAFRPVSKMKNITPQNVKVILYAKELVKTIEEKGLLLQRPFRVEQRKRLPY